MSFVLGVDVGQAKDFTALVLLERRYPAPDPDPNRIVIAADMSLACAFIERPALRTSYPAVVERVAEVLAKPRLRGRCDLVVDYTGVGRPIVDMMRGASLPVQPVTITGGHKETFDDEEGAWRVPKRDLVSRLLTMVDSGRLKFAPKLELAGTLAKELDAFRPKTSAHGHSNYESWREGVHDDLVLALALATWWALKSPHVPDPRAGGKPHVFSPERADWDEQQFDDEEERRADERKRWGSR